LLVAVGISLLISGCSVKSGVEGNAWFQCASKYDQAMSKMWASNGLKGFDKVLIFKEKFLRVTQPTETEIIAVLRSPSRSFQKVALVAMSIKPIETEQLIDILFEFLEDQEAEFRWYAMISLDNFIKFPESRKADLGERLLEIVKNAEDEALPHPQRFALLARFPSEEAVLFLAEQMMREGEGDQIRYIRYSAFRALKEMGDSYYEQAAEHVNKHGSPEIKKELLRSVESIEM